MAHKEGFGKDADYQRYTLHIENYSQSQELE